MASVLAGTGSSLAPAQRATRGLQVLYDFSSASGPLIQDRSGTGLPLNLRIAEDAAVERSKGTLRIRRGARVQSHKPARQLVEAIKRSGEITIEAWIKPADTRQSGPARIISLSRNSTNRNFTLGQDGDRFDVRFRSTRTSNNGLPSLPTETGSVTTRLTHLVHTRERSGRSRVYINGKQVAGKSIPGDPANWDQDYHLLLGNEADGSRPWLGSYHLVAIYSRDLSPAEVLANFRAGATEGGSVPEQRDPRAIYFENEVAPILASHCIECHDPATRKGKLDLTRRSTAFVTLEDGLSIVAGAPEKSLLWEAVFHDEMPEGNDPLNEEQKATLRKWIEDGAVWPLA
ncbi:MAG: LamG-like jellyroll fold domain-containing protein, partial [Verrucomicrobiota bacterium]|nr:LamG-like jellyroll fold domain-containing protein [Verrucomicrobiota bacterium]